MKKHLIAILFFAATTFSFAQKADTLIGSGIQPKVVVYYFHITNRCNTCRKIEAKTIKTLDSLFSKEIKEGTLKFASYNCEIDENKELVKKYDAYGATLAVTISTDGTEIKTEDLTNWAFSTVNKTVGYEKELAEKIRGFLK